MTWPNLIWANGSAPGGVPVAPSGTFPAGSNAWNGQPSALTPAQPYFTPQLKSFAEEMNYVLGTITEELQYLFQNCAVVLMQNFTSSTANTTTLTGTATVTNGSTTVTFSAAQTLALGTVIAFSSQPNVGYIVAAPITASTTCTLTTAYTGTTSSTATATTGGWTPPVGCQSIIVTGCGGGGGGGGGSAGSALASQAALGGSGGGGSELLTQAVHVNPSGTPHSLYTILVGPGGVGGAAGAGGAPGSDTTISNDLGNVFVAPGAAGGLSSQNPIATTNLIPAANEQGVLMGGAPTHGNLPPIANAAFIGNVLGGCPALPADPSAGGPSLAVSPPNAQISSMPGNVSKNANVGGVSGTPGNSTTTHGGGGAGSGGGGGAYGQGAAGGNGGNGNDSGAAGGTVTAGLNASATTGGGGGGGGGGGCGTTGSQAGGAGGNGGSGQLTILFPTYTANPVG